MAAPTPKDAIELLAPAKNADFGIVAVEHGADAVYIGGPSFGARSGAGNSVADIERLARHAHRYRARVLVALNTILMDSELDAARRLVRQVHEAGADALIVQDMGLLELDLPPIELHASTQCDIRTPEKARFLAGVGFSQMALARELSLPEIAAIAAVTDATLEFFVHGALCVSYSGQCYLSHATTGRSANRGDCSQACRLPYSLTAPGDAKAIASGHLLSLKDNDQSENLGSLIDVGIRSFKIEGRLKDLAYVKNVTAHYRQRLDALMERSYPSLRRASSGRCHFTFTPQPGKTFNRGATDYFVHGRSTDIGAFASPKFVGEAIGTVLRIGRDHCEISSTVALNNGDGLSYFDARGELHGLRINRVERAAAGYRIFPAPPAQTAPRAPARPTRKGGTASHAAAAPPFAGLRIGTPLHRNHDQEFARRIERDSSERRIALTMRLDVAGNGLRLLLRDEDDITAEAGLTADATMQQEPVVDAPRAIRAWRDGLAKLGESIYVATHIDLPDTLPWHVPASAINALRRQAVAALDAARAAAWQGPARRPAVVPPLPYPAGSLSYLGNVSNRLARAFYARHGVSVIAPAYECGAEAGEVSLMITRHCLRFSLQLCPRQQKGLRPEPLILQHGAERLTLRFDCKRCEMHVVGKASRTRPPALQAYSPSTAD